MKKLVTAARNFIVQEEGATMVEYAIMVALIAIVSILTITALGIKVNTIFGRVDSALAPVASGP